MRQLKDGGRCEEHFELICDSFTGELVGCPWPHADQPSAEEVSFEMTGRLSLVRGSWQIEMQQRYPDGVTTSWGAELVTVATAAGGVRGEMRRGEWSGGMAGRFGARQLASV